jgi:drug/metabolite transporter (DMT)-like permease
VGDVVDGGSLDQAGPGFTNRDQPGKDALRSASKPVPSQPGAQAYLHVALMVLFGSTTAPAARYVVHSLPLQSIPSLRFGLACLCLLPLVWIKGGLGRLIRQDGWRLVLAAALCVPINQAFFLGATKLGLTSHVALFYATCPLVVLLLAWSFRMERPNFARLAGVLLSVAGIVVIGIGHYLEHRSTGGDAAHSVVLSDLLLLGAVASWGGYIVVSKPLIVRHGAMTVLAGTVLTGFLLSVPFAFLDFPSLNSLRQVPFSAWTGLIFLGLCITPFAWAYQNLALRSFDASQVATFSNASPILTVIWGMWLFGEVLTPTLVAGGAMTLGGIYWACRPRRRGSRVVIRRGVTIVRRAAESSQSIPALPALALAKEVVTR